MSTFQPFELGRSDFADPPKWGFSHTVALALVAMDLDLVSRETLRALLPAGTIKRPKTVNRASGVRILNVNRMTPGARRLAELGAATDFVPQRTPAGMNRVTDRFQKVLGRMEASGWISRGERYVLVRDRRGLMDWATAADLPPEIELAIAPAIEALLTTPVPSAAKAAAQREAELRALKRLMEQGLGVNWSGRGSVRFVPRSTPYLPIDEGDA